MNCLLAFWIEYIDFPLSLRRTGGSTIGFNLQTTGFTMLVLVAAEWYL